MRTAPFPHPIRGTARLIPGAVITLSAISIFCFNATAHAATYDTVHHDQSTITFTAKQMGVPVDGKFGKFTAQVSFDPTQPQTARASINIDLTSIDAGLPEASEEAAGKLWFNTRAYPTARFASTGVKALGSNRYEVAGTLTIKGRTRQIAAPFTVTQQGSQAIFDGSFVIRRADFGIGEGMWADFDTVANEVPVKFRIVANATNMKL